MALNGLVHNKAQNKLSNSDLDPNLHVWVMAGLPVNILQADEFAEIFDGFSIGLNDLTQLTLGIDSDSKFVRDSGNENNKSVYRFIHTLIQSAHAKGLKVDICGQGPADFAEFAEFVVREDVDSVSLTPDTVLKTI